MYMTGFRNFNSFDEAYRVFKMLPNWVALDEHNDGKATITFLTDKPVQKDQVEYVGTDSTMYSK